MSWEIFKWKKLTTEEKTDWCLKWFKIVLILMCFQASVKIIEAITLIRAVGSL